MRVIRVEDAEGGGAYRGKSADWDIQATAFFDTDRHPAPCADSGISGWWQAHLFEREEYSFGFRDESQFRSWFFSDDVLAVMHDHGLLLVTYDVPDDFVQIGNAQLLFRKDKAKKIISRSLLSFCANK